LLAEAISQPARGLLRRAITALLATTDENVKALLPAGLYILGEGYDEKIYTTGGALW
jgi:hypothetical protein